MTSNPPPYSDHPNYSQSPPPQAPGNFPPQQMPMPMPPYNQQQQPLYPPQQPMMPPPNVTIVTQQPSSGTVIVRTIPILGPEPCLITCPNCYANTMTSVKHEISGRTHCCALLFCLTGLWPCAIFPYICGGCCQKTVHTCASCGHFVGSC